MECFNPIFVDVPYYMEGSGIRKMRVPCGKCEACIDRLMKQWYCRLKEEMKVSETCYHLTLQYDEAHVPFTQIIDSDGNPPRHVRVFRKRDVQLFLKRLRKRLPGVKLKYFCVSEYGPTTLRPHFHMILFGFPSDLNPLPIVTEAWKNGYVVCRGVSDGSLRYVTQYTHKKCDYPDYLPKPFRMMSQNLGISYLTPEMVSYQRERKNNMRYFDGKFEYGMPRYYRVRILDDSERMSMFADYLLELKRQKDEESSAFRIANCLKQKGLSYHNADYVSLCKRKKAEEDKRADFQRRADRRKKKRKDL